MKLAHLQLQYGGHANVRMGSNCDLRHRLALRLKCGDALHLALPAEVGLEFGKDPQHVKEALPGCGGGVHLLLCHQQVRALLPERPDDVLKVGYGTGQPVNAGYD